LVRLNEVMYGRPIPLTRAQPSSTIESPKKQLLRRLD
jgi:hypothetical protein